MQLAHVAVRTDRGVQLHRRAWPITTHYWLGTRCAPRVLHFSAFHFFDLLFKVITRTCEIRVCAHSPPRSARWFFINFLIRNCTWQTSPWQQVVGGINCSIQFVWLLGALVQHKYLFPVSYFTCVQDGLSPVYVASQNGHTEVVDLLVQAGADIHLATTKVCTC